MGFLTPTPPPFDVEEWKAKPHLARIKPLAQDWAINGFGTPTAVYLLYAVKLVIFSVGAALTISATTAGLGGLGDFSQWWTEPIVFQKLAVWTLLWEILGLGCGSMPLTFRFQPLIGSVLYWLRPGTVRLPPWPDKVPFTRGNTRTISMSPSTPASSCSGSSCCCPTATRSPDWRRAGSIPRSWRALLGVLVLLGLRDKVSFLGARTEVYGLMLAGLAVPGRELHRRLADRVRLHLVGRGRFEAQPPLPVRGVGDDLQHPLEPLAQGQGGSLQQHGGSAPVQEGGASRPTWGR